MNRVCLFPVIGNHECEQKWPRIPFRYLENYSVPNGKLRRTEYYYSFDYGNAHFCMIDVYSSKFETGSKQYEWLKQDLKKSEKPWKFAVMHYPVYVQRKAPSVTYGNMEVREYLVPLFQEYGVSMVISGDSHFYQRSEMEGIHYVCSGGGGAPLYDPGNEEPYVRASYKGYHYVWIDIDGEHLTLKAYNNQNDLIDTFKTTARKMKKPEAPRLNYTRRMPKKNQKPGQGHPDRKPG